MDISVTEFKRRCLELIRHVERTGKPVTITRRGKVVARLQPSHAFTKVAARKPWERVRLLGGRLLAKPGESVLRDQDFEALRRPRRVIPPPAAAAAAGCTRARPPRAD